MKTSYRLPNGTYNMVISKEDLNELLNKGHLTIHTTRDKCAVGRSVWDEGNKRMISVGDKEVENILLFRTDEPIADMEAGVSFVQFINIVLDDSCGFGCEDEKED